MLGQCTQTGNMRGICARHAQKDPLDAVITSRDRKILPLKHPPRDRKTRQRDKKQGLIPESRRIERGIA